ncbi:P-loop NTPase [Methanopyrus sp.]
MDPEPSIAVLGGKGGVGKTVLSIALAAELGVPLVDADVTEPDVPAYLELEVEEVLGEIRARYAVRTDGCVECGRCLEVCPWDAVEDPIACDGCGICSIACPEDAIEFESEALGEIVRSRNPDLNLEVIHPRSEPWVPELAHVIHRMIPRRPCVIDCSAGLGCPVIAALSRADAAVLVTSPDPAARHDFERARTLVGKHGLPSVTVLNRAEGSVRGDFDVVIPESEDVLNAALRRDARALYRTLRPHAREIIEELRPEGSFQGPKRRP